MKQVIRNTLAKANNIDQEKKIYTVLVDGNNLLKKSLVNKTINSDGKEYGAIMTFVRMLGNILLKKDFDYVYCMWDGNNSGVLRYEFYPEYKANRDKHYKEVSNLTDYDRRLLEYQKKVLEYSKNRRKVTKRSETDDEIFERERAVIQNILENLCVRQMMCDNVEGDDLIAEYVKIKNHNEKIVIVSEDRDLTQLVSEDVTVWIPSKQVFVTPKNDIEILGKPAKNVVLVKMLCGDNSDNIYGIDGLGETTLLKYFPEINEQTCYLEGIIAHAKELLEQRAAEKKKPIKVLQNIVDCVTKGCQGNRIYEINRKLIDLSAPLLTKDAKEEMGAMIHAPLDMEDRDAKNVYKIVQENKMQMLLSENSFSNAFSPYTRIIEQEKKRAQKVN